MYANLSADEQSVDLLAVLKSGAILVTLVFAAGVFNTSLLSYFVQRDLSTAIYKVRIISYLSIALT